MDKKKAILLSAFAVILALSFDSALAQVTSYPTFDEEIIQINDDGSKTVKLTNYGFERILDNGNYRDFIFTNKTNSLQVETMHGSIQLDKSSCAFSYFSKNKIQQNQIPLFTDSIIARMATNGTDDWISISQINNANCVTSWDGSTLQAKKFKSGVGVLLYRYINTGDEWKTELEVINLSAQTNKKFAFTQTIDINRDTIKFGDTLRNLDNFNNQTFNRAWIESHESKVIDLFNGFKFDFDLAYENLWAISVYDTGPNSSKISFDFARNSEILLPNESRVYDPTYTQGSGGDTRSIYNGAPRVGVGQKFSTGHTLVGTTVTSVSFWLREIGSATGTATAYIKDSGNTVKATMGTTDVSVIGGSFVKITFSSSSGAITNGDKITLEYGVGDAGNHIQIESSASNVDANAVMQELVAGSWSNIAEDLKYEVIYTTVAQPNAVTDLTATATSKTTIFLDFSQPELHGESLLGYQINYTTPTGTPLTIFINNTGSSTTEYTLTGLTACTAYSARVSPWTAGGNNATGNIANATTSCYTTPSAPTLAATAESDTSVRFTSVNGTTGDYNIAWYGLRCELNGSGGWLTTVSNTTVPNPRVHIYTGLTTADTIICQWRDGSAAGWGPYSANASSSPALDVIEPQRAAGSDRLTQLAAWFDSLGGVYMGMSLFPFLVMMIGLLARPRTTHIFTIITLCFMGIIHASGYYVYPDWFWTLSLLFGLVIVLAKKYT